MSRSPQEEIYLQVRGQFKAAEKCAEKLKVLIAEYYPRYLYLDRATLLLITKMIRKDFKKEEWSEVKYMFKSIFVYILAHYKPHLFLNDMAEFIEIYPEFSDSDEVEKTLLLQFRNYFTIACEIIEPNNHKGELIALVGRMCGAIYVTGGGQTSATDRRSLIYERETGIAPRLQPHRKKKVIDPATLSLQALTTQRNEIEAVHVDPVLNKRARYEMQCTEAQRRSTESFWNNRKALMESGQDIPCKLVPADQANSSFAYPSHDLPFNNSHAVAMANHPSMHPSMRFLHDPLRRSQMPMSMQMQLPPGHPLTTSVPMRPYNGTFGAEAGVNASAGAGLSAVPAGVTANGATNGTVEGAAAGPNAGNAIHTTPLQLPSFAVDPHKFQTLQHTMSLPSFSPLYDIHSLRLPYGSYYAGPASASHQPYLYSQQQQQQQQHQKIPLASIVNPNERFASRALPQPPHSVPPQGCLSSQYNTNKGPHTFSGPVSAGYPAHGGPPCPPWQQTFALARAQPPLPSQQSFSQSHPLFQTFQSGASVTSASALQQQQQQQQRAAGIHPPLAHPSPEHYYKFAQISASASEKAK